MELESNILGASCTSLKELYNPIKIYFIFFFFFFLAMSYTPKRNQIHNAILILTFFFFSFFLLFLGPKKMSCFANHFTFL